MPLVPLAPEIRPRAMRSPKRVPGWPIALAFGTEPALVRPNDPFAVGTKAKVGRGWRLGHSGPLAKRD